MEEEKKKIFRPVIIFAGSYSVIDNLTVNRKLHSELRKDNIFNFGFRFCRRYCTDETYFEKRDREEKTYRKTTNSNHFNKINYHWIIHFDPESPCAEWREFVKSIRKYKRVTIIEIPTANLETKHFIEAIEILRKNISKRSRKNSSKAKKSKQKSEDTCKTQE